MLNINRRKAQPNNNSNNNPIQVSKMSDSAYQQYFLTKQNVQPRKYKTSVEKNREILYLQKQASILQNTLKRDVELKRSPSLSISKPIRPRNTVTRQTSFHQTSTQARSSLSQEDIEFSIIKLESLTVGLKCEILDLQETYTGVEITKERNKNFIKGFMTLWRRINELEGKYKILFDELPSTHEYTHSYTPIKNWLGGLRKQLWAQRERTGDQFRVYELRRKEEEQQRLLEVYFRNFERKETRTSTSRNYISSPVESEFGSEISCYSSESSYSSTSS